MSFLIEAMDFCQGAFPGIPPGKNDGQESDSALLRTAICYLLSGEAGYAYTCLDRIVKGSYAALYNKALCLYLATAYEECFHLLCEAEHLLLHNIVPSSKPLPEKLTRWNLDKSTPFCPMPDNAPPDIAQTQVLRLKAETAGKLQLTEEIKRIASGPLGKYVHIKNLMNTTQTSHDNI